MHFKDMDGRRVKSMVWSNPEEVSIDYSTDKLSYKRANLSHEYYGDHAENWIVITSITTGKEITRHNTTYIDTIEWWLNNPTKCPSCGLRSVVDGECTECGAREE